jgi:hypothetical protein
MKKILTVLILALLVVLPSCLNNGKYETTPCILIDKDMIVNGEDTLGARFVVEENKFCLDTMVVGDSLQLLVLFDAVGNNITKASVSYLNEFASLQVHESEDLVDIITSTITDNSYSCTVEKGYRGIYFEMTYVPIKAGKGEIDFRIESDSEYSPAELKILTPIVEEVSTPEPDPEPDPDPEP